MATTGRHGPLIGAVDQGTSSTRFLIFAANTAELLTYHQTEVRQIYPKEGWVEQDPMEILQTVYECMDKAVHNLKGLGIDPADIKGIGITNQRETTVVWDKSSGEPLYNAIVWLDGRTADTVTDLLHRVPGANKEYLKPKCGLPISTYFSAVKLRWLLDNSNSVRRAVQDKRCLFGTVDSWLLWNLTGGVTGGKHYTDVTNASRTMLMNVHSLQWDNDLCRFFDIPMTVLPKIKSSAEIYGHIKEGALAGRPIAGILGDQQAALVGQTCFKRGQAKNTYGTGCFLLYNTGPEAVFSDHGLLTTVAYKLGKDKPVCYALEGSIAIAGAAVQWLKDNIGIINKSSEIETLAGSVESTHGCYFVPAFSGLFCPYWQPEARGIICGLSQFTTKAHLARACLEAVAFQTRELLDAMNKDSGIPIESLQVDGGMTANSLCMQIQADLAGIPVVRPSMPETTALGAAMAAGVAVGVWSLRDEDLTTITTDVFTPATSHTERDQHFSKWKMAIQRSMNWQMSEPQRLAAEEPLWTTLPGGLFVFLSAAMLVVSQLMKSS